MTTTDGAVLGTTQISGISPRNRAFNVVLLAEGFTNAQQNDFNNACTTFINNFRSTVPFDKLISAINVFRVNVSSTDSGADDPVVADGGTGATARTYFDSSFGGNNIRRLLVCNTTTALQVAAAQVPEFTVVLVVVNSTIYGGSGGTVGTYSLAGNATEIAIHEMGHTAFGLADEYAYLAGGTETGHDRHPPGEPSQPNVTTNIDRNTLKWRSAVASTTVLPTMSNPNCAQVDNRGSTVPAGTVGLFEGAHYYHCGAYRPEHTCKMQSLGVPFCHVCQQVISDRISPLLSFSGISSGGNNLYQLHRSGLIWKYTGTPCAGDSCPGWQLLDNNSATVAIAADGNNLYQLHRSGLIWKYTGTPCAGDSCPGWQLLDNNSATVAIAVGGNNLYQLHRSGLIWKYTGTPCAGNSCPGWQLLDNNSATVAIAADGNGHLYQLHGSGLIWKYTGTPCTGNSCPGWQMLDNNFATATISSGTAYIPR
jgi:hypothetical protein